MASTSANITGPVLNSIKEGLLSCVTKVYNSLTTMKEAVVDGFNRLTGMLRPAQAQPKVTDMPPFPVKTAIDPVPLDVMQKICQTVQLNMATDSKYLNGMFREATTVKPCVFNAQLKNPDTFLAAIDHHKSESVDNQKISGVDMGFLVKQWLGQALAENRVTPEQREMLVVNKDDKAKVNQILDEKFNHCDTKSLENKEKLILLLSVMRTYKEVCQENVNTKDRKYDSSVVGVVGIAQLFDFDEKLMSVDGAQSIKMRKQERDDMLTAFSALLTHCTPAAAPRITTP